MPPQPTKVPSSGEIQNSIRFGEDFELDFGHYQLRRAGRAIKLERIPMEVLLFLAERRGEVVTREQIVERIWGKDVFLDTDNSINGAIRKVRQVLKDDPEHARFIQTVTGKGYRFIAPVASEETAGPELVSSVESPPGAIERDVKPRPNYKWLVPTLLVLLIAALATYLGWLRPSGRSSVPGARVMLAVLPFDNLTGDPSQEYFSDGMTEEMTTELGRLNPDRLGVIGRTSVMLYKNYPKSLDQVGRELGVQYVIEGSVRRDADRVRITAQLIETKNQTHVWARQYDRELKNLLTLQAEIAREIANEIELTLSEKHNAHAAVRPGGVANTTSFEAYDLYLKGRYFWNKRTGADFQQAAELFQQAIARDPNFARPYVGLADTYALMSTWFVGPQTDLMPKARVAALKAIALDPALGEAHTSLGLIAEAYDYDWETAEKEFRRAIELSPDYATGHQWYAEYLAWQGRFDEAFAESERARQLDPLSLIIANDYGKICYLNRQFDRAIAEFRAEVSMDPNFDPYQKMLSEMLFEVYVQENRFAEALKVLESAPADSPWTWAYKAILYGRWGRTSEADQALLKFEDLAPKLGYWEKSANIKVYVATGRKDRALTLLEEGFADHSLNPAGIKVDPAYDPLRGDPRFQQLLRRLRLAQ